MAGKISTLVLKVDLECHLCYKKIRKTLCKLQDRENIKTISYDEKKNTVTISGPFDPQKLSKKLRCKACKVIKDIQIIEIKDKPKEPPKEPPTEKEKPKPASTEKEKPKPAPTEKEKPKPAPIEKEKPKSEPPPKAEPAPQPKPEPPAPKPNPPKTEPAQPKVEPTPVHPPVWPTCCWMPYYEGYYGGCRCCSCGRVYGWVANPPVVYGGPSHEAYKPCHFFCEEDPSTSCNIM